MSKRRIKIAICYDFDGTLTPGNMQEHSLLPDLNQKPQKFWQDVKDFAQNNNMNEILAYMHLILARANETNHKITRKAFRNHGKSIPLFEGVDNFFNEINDYALNNDVKIEHYIISSGLKEIIEGTKINKNFKFIFASEFFYDVNGVAKWPAVAIDYTAKTQYLFRINKGIFNVWDNSKINKYIPEEKRYMPFRKIIYIGDGETDIPCMKMVNFQGGYSIAVYDPNRKSTKNKKSPKQICQELIEHGRAKYIAPAYFKKDGDLFQILVNIINKIHVEAKLNQFSKKNNY